MKLLEEGGGGPGRVGGKGERREGGWRGLVGSARGVLVLAMRGCAGRVHVHCQDLLRDVTCYGIDIVIAIF